MNIHVSEGDMTIVPIKVSLEEGGCMSLASKRLQMEECWYKEVTSINFIHVERVVLVEGAK